MSQGIDVKQWLNDNQLLDVLDTFVKRQVSIEELLEFDINDIQLIAKCVIIFSTFTFSQ